MDPITFRTDALFAASRPAASGGSPGEAFSSVLKGALDRVNSVQNQADGLAREFQMDNPNVSLEETMIAVQKANISFQALVQVRNKLAAAYQDLMNMPV